MIEDLKVRIVPRMGVDPSNGKPAPFTEIFYEFVRDGVPLKALSRRWEVYQDTPHARAYHAEQFRKRQAS